MHCLWSFIVQLLLYWSLATSQVRSSIIGNALSTGYVNLLQALADQSDSNLLTPSASDLSPGTTIITSLHVTNFFDRTNIVCSDLTTNTANIVCSELTTNTANMVMSSSSSDIFKDISSQKVLNPYSTFESQHFEAVSSDIRIKPISLTVFSTVQNLLSASFESSFFVFSDTLAAEPSKMSTEPIGTEINLVLATIEPNRLAVSSSGELGRATIEPSRTVVSSSGELGLATIEPSRAVVSSSGELGLATIEPNRAVVSSSGELGLATIEPSRAVVSSSGELGWATVEPSRAVVSSSDELGLATIEPSRMVVSSSGELGWATIEPSRAVVSSSGELGLATIEPSRAVVSSSGELGLATIEPSRAVVSSSGELGLATIEPSRAVVSSSGELGLATIEPSRAVVSSSGELGLATIEPSRAVLSSSRELKNTIYETSTFTVRSSGEDVLARTSIEPSLASVSSSRETDTPSMTLAEAFSVLSTFTAYTLDSKNRVLQDSLTLYETSLSDRFAEKTISTYSVPLFHETVMSLFSTALVEKAPFISGASADLVESAFFSVVSTKIGVLNTFHTSLSQDTANSLHSLLDMASLETSEEQGIFTETVRPIEINSSSVQSQALHFITFSNVSEASSHAVLPSVTHPITERTGQSELIDLLTSIAMTSVYSYILSDSQVWPLSTVEFPKRSAGFNLETATIILTTVQSPPLEKVYSNFIANDSAVLNLTSIGTVLVESIFQTSAVPVVKTSIIVASSFDDVSGMNEISTGYSTVSSLRTTSSEIKLDYSSLGSSDLYLDNIDIKTNPFNASILSSSVPLPKIISSPVSTVLISDVMMITAFPSSTFTSLNANTTYSAYKSTHSTLLATVNTTNADYMKVSLHPIEVLYSSLSSVLMPSNTVERTTFPLSSEIVQPTSTMVLSSSPTSSNNTSVLSTNDTSVLLSTIFSTLESTLMSNSKFITTSAVTMTTSHTIFPETASNIHTIMSEIIPSALLANSDTSNKSELTPSSMSELTPSSMSELTPSSMSELTPSSMSELTPSSMSELTPSSMSELTPSSNSNTKHISEHIYITQIVPSSFITETGALIITKAEDKTESLHSSTILFSSMSSVLNPTNTVEGTTFLLPSEMIHPSTTILVFSSSNKSSFVSVLNTSYQLVLQSIVLSTLASTSLLNSSFIIPSSFITESGTLFTTNAENKTVSLHSSTVLFSSLSSILSPTNTVEGTTFHLPSFNSIPAVTMTTVHSIFPEPTSSIHTTMSEITHSAVLGNSDTNNKSELTPSSVSDNTNTKHGSEKAVITHIVPSSVITRSLIATNAEDKTESLYSSTILFSSLSSILSPTNTVEGTTFLLSSEMILSSTKNNSSFVSMLNTIHTPVLLSTMLFTLGSTEISNNTFNSIPVVTMTTVHTTFPEPTSSIHTTMSEITHSAVLGNSDTNNKSEITPSSVSDNTNTKHVSENTFITHIVSSSVMTETGILITTQEKTVSLHSSTLLFTSFSSGLNPTNTLEATTFLLASEMTLSSPKINSSFVSLLNTIDTPILLSTMFSALGNSTMSNSTFIVTSSVITESGTIFTTNAENKTVSLHSSTVLFSSLSSILSPTNTVEGTTFLLSSEMILSSTKTNSFVSLLNTINTLVFLSTLSSALGSTTMSNSTFIVTSSVITETGILITSKAEDKTESLHSSSILFSSLSSVLNPTNTIEGTTFLLASFNLTPAVTMTTVHTTFPEPTSSIHTTMSEITHSAVLGNSDTNNKSEITSSSVSDNTNTKHVSENTVITHIVSSSVITETGILITTQDKTISLHSSTLLFTSFSSGLNLTNTLEATTFLSPSEMTLSSQKNNSSFVSLLNTIDTPNLLSTMLSDLGSTTMSNSTFIVTLSVITETGILITSKTEDKTESLHSSTIFFSSLSSILNPTNTVEGTTFLLPSEMIHPSTTILVFSSSNNSSFVFVLNTSYQLVLQSTVLSTLASTSLPNSSFIIPSSFITESGMLFTTNAENKTVSLHSSTVLFSSLSSILSPTNTVERTTFLLSSEMILSSTKNNSSFVSMLNTIHTPVLLSTMLFTLGSTEISNNTFNSIPAVTMTTVHTTFPEPTMTISTILSVIPPSNVSGNTSTKYMSEHTVMTPIVHSPVITETKTGTRFLNSTLIAGFSTIVQMSTPSTMTSVTMATGHSPVINVTSSANTGTIMPSSVPETLTVFTNTTRLLTSAWSSLPQTSFLHFTDTEVFESSSMAHVLTSYSLNLTPSLIASSALSSSLNVTLISTPLLSTSGITVMPTSVLMTQLTTLISDTVTPKIFSTSAFNNITVNVSDETTTLTTAVIFSNVTELVFSNVTEVMFSNVTELEFSNVTELVFSNVTEVVSTNFSVHSTLAVSTFSMSIYNISTTKMPILSTSTTAATPNVSSLATSSSVLTTTVKPSTSTATIQPSKAPMNITEAGENYWVITVLKVPKTKNISSPTFRSSIEAGLAEAYLQAYTRKEYIRLGVFDPLKKKRRRRKKRYIKAEDTAVHVQRISQDAGTSAVSVAYSVENNGSVVPAVDAVNTLAIMDIQELAIILKEVVSTKAETYIKFVSPGSGTAEAGGMAVWMIASIAGGVAALIIIVFVVACCCFKCSHQQRKTDIKGQPQLVGLKTPLEEESEFVVTRVDPEYLNEQPKQGNKASLLSQKSRKSQRYEVTQPGVQDETPVKKRDLSRSKTSSIFNSHSEGSRDREPVEGNVISPSRNNRLKGSGLLNDQTPGPEDSPVLFRNMSADEDDELKKKAEMERKLNKERIRERIKDRRRKERNQGVANDSLREEIDRILEAPAENGLPHVFVDSSREKKKKDKESGQSNEGFAMEEETLEEARKRMHKLLDETFSLVSPEASSVELRKAVRSLSPSSVHHESAEEELSDDDTAHTPMYVTPVTYSKPTLETWSPYRASDQVALISMPKSQQTTIKSATTQPQTKPLRRPVASFPETSTVASQERKYTTSPPKPIVITSRELLKPSTLDEQKPVSAVTLITGVSKGLKNPSLGKLSKRNIDENDTNLSQSGRLMTNGNAGSFEMKMLNSSQGKRRKHKRHGHEPKNYDEIDIITNNLKTGESTADYIRSIRKEIQHKPDRMDPERKLRTSMTDIV